MNPQTLYLERYEKNLTDRLLRLCTEMGALNGQLLETPDLETVWEAVAQPYVADALPEIPKYPTVAIGWMGFVGMALAHLWETGWAPCAQHPERIYPALRNARGFDALDDHILDNVLGLGEDAAETPQLCFARAALRRNGTRRASPRRDRTTKSTGVPCVCAQFAHALPHRGGTRIAPLGLPL